MKITDACVGQDHELNIFYINDFDFNLIQIHLKTTMLSLFGVSGQRGELTKRSTACEHTIDI